MRRRGPCWSSIVPCHSRNVSRLDDRSALPGERLSQRGLGAGRRAILTRVAPQTTSSTCRRRPYSDRAGIREAGGSTPSTTDTCMTPSTGPSRLRASRVPAAIAWTPAVVGAIEHLAPHRFVYDSLDNWVTHPILRRHADRARDRLRAPASTRRCGPRASGCDPSGAAALGPRGGRPPERGRPRALRHAGAATGRRRHPVRSWAMSASSASASMSR